MNKRLELFLGLSEVLTGVSRIQLFGTAMADQYFQTLNASLPEGVLDKLIVSYEQISASADREAAVQANILGDPQLGSVARNLILLWYCGNWMSLPDAWHAAYGTSPTEKTGVVSGQAYQAGLQWVVIGAHAPGSSQQGFASWSFPPER